MKLPVLLTLFSKWLVVLSRSTSINCCEPYNRGDKQITLSDVKVYYIYQRNCNTTYSDRINGRWFVRWIYRLDIDTWKKWTVMKSHKCQSRIRNSNILLHLKYKNNPSLTQTFLILIKYVEIKLSHGHSCKLSEDGAKGSAETWLAVDTETSRKRADQQVTPRYGQRHRLLLKNP